MIRACIDTSVLVSGLISPKGVPHELILALTRRDFLLITSQEILDELNEVLDYPKIKKAYKLTPDEIKRYLKLLRKHAYRCQASSNVQVIEDDPDDDKFLAAAIDGRADFIVSGDSHLVNLRSFHGIPVLTPTQFFEALSNRMR